MCDTQKQNNRFKAVLIERPVNRTSNTRDLIEFNFIRGWAGSFHVETVRLTINVISNSSQTQILYSIKIQLHLQLILW